MLFAFSFSGLISTKNFPSCESTSNTANLLLCIFFFLLLFKDFFSFNYCILNWMLTLLSLNLSSLITETLDVLNCHLSNSLASLTRFISSIFIISQGLSIFWLLILALRGAMHYLECCVFWAGSHQLKGTTAKFSEILRVNFFKQSLSKIKLQRLYIKSNKYSNHITFYFILFYN